MRKTIGIIGGMGPAATVDLMEKIIEMTEAQDDQHHIPLLVDSNTHIPDRTLAILSDGESPVPEMLKSARRLEQAGADFLIIACNTAHYFIPDIADQIGVPILSMLEVAAERMQTDGVTSAGILATDGVVNSGLYEKPLAERGIRAVYPDSGQQQEIMHLIYDLIKKGVCDKDHLPVSHTRKILEDMRARGAEKFLLACTELPIAFEHMEIYEDCVDPTTLLARAAILKADALTA